MAKKEIVYKCSVFIIKDGKYMYDQPKELEAKTKEALKKEIKKLGFSMKKVEGKAYVSTVIYRFEKDKSGVWWQSGVIEAINSPGY